MDQALEFVLALLVLGSRVQKVNGEQVPVEVEMKAENGSRTELVLEKVDPTAALTEADFTEEAMQR